VANLDKSNVNFSKKQSLIVHESLLDYYTVKCRRPITDDKAVVQIYLSTSSPDIQVEPQQLSLDIRQQQCHIKVAYVGQSNQKDQEYSIEHRTLSSEFELHKLVITLKCYKLG
jgi:hypothetical protein